FTTKSPGSGLGLGLSISARIIQDLGGRIEAQNLSDGGACFTLILPRAEPPESSPHPSEERQTHA
ncbi:MAG: sensor histidine kinase, partial [Halomonadaceae bacterium]|nr:sensor histidine kinase [Halomonadaceae bacterium]